MDGFSGYNQIQIKPKDQHNTAFIFPWGTFAYQKMPFSPKNAGATLQRDMNLTFHDLNHIIKVYLNNLATQSHVIVDHLDHLHLVFERCRHYEIWLNPHKYIFCIKVGHLLGFIVSKEGIRVDPLNI